MILKLDENTGTISVEHEINGVKSYKQIDPDTLKKCVFHSTYTQWHSGLLPEKCLSVTVYADNKRDISLVLPPTHQDIIYHKTLYINLPLPQMVWIFSVNNQDKISGVRVCAAYETKPDSPTFHYPFSNTNDNGNMCLGSNELPKIKCLSDLNRYPYLILALPNNDDHFNPLRNRKEMGMRDLMEKLKNATPEAYQDILKPTGKTLSNWLGGR